EVTQEQPEKWSDESASNPDLEGPEEVAALTDVGDLVHHDLVQQVADPPARLRLVGQQPIQQRIELTVERHAQELRHERHRIREGSGDPREQTVQSLLDRAQGHPADVVQSERSEHLLEKSDVTELLGEVISTDAGADRLGVGQSWAGVPGCADS